MHDVYDWLETEVDTRELLVITPLISAVLLAVAIGTLMALQLVGVTLPNNSSGLSLNPATLLPVLAVGALIEELICRAPLTLAAHISNRAGIRWFPLVSAILLSILFGVLHGSVANIAIQGVAGIVYSVIYLKSNPRGFWKAIFFSTYAHIAYNSILVSIMYLLGYTTF